MDGIQISSKLKSLNLSNNNIDSICDLSKLANLEFLNLSFNLLQKLDGFLSMHGQKYKLKFIDLKGNQISDYKQLSYLAGCSKLEHLILKGTHQHQTAKENPICNKSNYSQTVFELLSNLLSLDGFDYKERPVDTHFDPISYLLTDFLGDTSTAVNNSMYQQPQIPIQKATTPNREERAREPSTQQVMDKMNELEKKMIETLKQPITTKEEKSSEGSERLFNLETHIVKLVEVLVENTKPKEPNVIKEEVPVVKVNGNEDRLKSIEAQMKELIQMTASNNNLKSSLSPPQKSLKKQLNALKALENELLNPSMSPNSSDEALNAAIYQSQIPRAKENTPPTPLQEVQNTRPASPIKKIIRAPGTKPPKITQVEAANAKLISALEAEERRLRDNEVRYAEKVKALTSQLEIERGGVVKAQEFARMLDQNTRKLSALQNELKRSQEVKDENLRNYNQSEKEKTDLERQLFVATSTLKASEERLADFKETALELASTRKELEAALELQKKSESARIEAQDVASIITTRLHKERELFKIKIAEVSKEKNLAIAATGEISRQLEYFKQTLSEKEAGFREKIEKLINSQQYEIESRVSKASQVLHENHSLQIRSLQESLYSSQQAYKELEVEFRSAIEQERRSKASLQTTLSQRTEEVHLLANRDKEQTSTIADLVQLVKELKVKVEKSSQAESQVTKIHRDYVTSAEKEMKNLLAEKESLRHKALALERTCSRLEEENKGLVIEKRNDQTHQVKLAELQATTAAKIQDLERTIFQLSKEYKTAKAKLADTVDVIKVKESMLEDQNATIKTLKLNLENKAREFQGFAKELEECRHELESRDSSTHTALESLHHKLEAVEASEEHYRTIALEYKKERDQVRKECDSAHLKLSERNASIEKIEHEVEKVETHFQTKLAALDQAHKVEMEALMRKTQSDREISEYYGREKEALLAKLKETQKQLEASLQQRRELETELKYVVKHMDLEKSKSEEKMRKLKAALAS